MASTLLSSDPSYGTTPLTSPLAQVPNVFVVPPEEDESPTWCYFDATEVPESALSTAPNFYLLESVLNVFQTQSEAPVFHRDSGGPPGSRGAVIMPKKSLKPRSITNVLMNHEFHDSDDEMELERVCDELSPRDEGIARNSAVGNDSEIVEVVKVRRHAQDGGYQNHAHAPPMKRSKSFKSRASKVFRSIRTATKGPTQRKHHALNTFSSPSVTDGEPSPTTKAPTMSRRGSAIFSQFFSSTTLQSRSSVTLSDASRNSLGSSPRSTASVPTSSSLYDCTTPSTLPTNSFPPPLGFDSCELPPSLGHDRQETRSHSPTLSTYTSSSRRRFSMMSLQRLFSLSADAESLITDTPPILSPGTSRPSTISSPGPDTPIEEEMMPLPPYQFQLPLQDLEKTDSDTHVHQGMLVSTVEPGDVTFEMRLDSLHFDSLSFDVDRF